MNTFKRILLVEGDDDKHFVKNFCCKVSSNILVCKLIDEDNRDNDNDSRSVFYVDSGSRQESGVSNMIRKYHFRSNKLGKNH